MKKLLPFIVLFCVISFTSIFGETGSERNPNNGNSEHQTNEKEKYYFSLSPGLNLTGNTLRIKTSSETAIMVQKEEMVPSWFLDFRSTSYSFTKNFGAYLWIKNSFFVLDRQKIQDYTFWPMVINRREKIYFLWDSTLSGPVIKELLFR